MIVSVGRGALPGAPAIVSIDPDTDIVQSVPRARTVGKTGKVRVAVARPGGSDQVFVDGTVPARYFRYSVPLAIDDPPKFFGAALKSRLRAAGIELTGAVVERAVKPDNAWALIATTESDLMPTMSVSNKHSQSFYAEQIFKTLAAEKTGRGTWDGALALSRQFLASIGLDPARYDIHDGSGLSAANRVAAGDMVKFLRAMNAPPPGSPVAVHAGRLRGPGGVAAQPPDGLGDPGAGPGQDRHPERRLDPRGLRPGRFRQDLRLRHPAQRRASASPAATPTRTAWSEPSSRRGRAELPVTRERQKYLTPSA